MSQVLSSITYNRGGQIVARGPNVACGSIQKISEFEISLNVSQHMLVPTA